MILQLYLENMSVLFTISDHSCMLFNCATREHIYFYLKAYICYNISGTNKNSSLHFLSVPDHIYL